MEYEVSELYKKLAAWNGNAEAKARVQIAVQRAENSWNQENDNTANKVEKLISTEDIKNNQLLRVDADMDAFIAYLERDNP